MSIWDRVNERFDRRSRVAEHVEQMEHASDAMRYAHRQQSESRMHRKGEGPKDRFQSLNDMHLDFKIQQKSDPNRSLEFRLGTDGTWQMEAAHV